ncbi:hypothetical protein BASA81_016563 [Batrachochytrium salamandrivorans]|nr:hypothetical protein BASA81_016563 [Batrachochytrium salamandrivorans]
MQPIIETLQHENNKLERLELSLKIVYDNAPARAIARVLKHKDNKIERLSFTFIEFGTNEVKRLSQGLQHPHCNIASLDFVDLLPGAAVIHALMEALMHENNQVRKLELNFYFYEAEKKMLFEALSHVNNKVVKFTQVTRIGKRAAMRRLPRELVGMVGEMLK